ncbi:ATP-binding protein [Chitinasiproducens palmae]|uniref:histidine kinase n=1 Tax=Chitinasiproducens palmae TaxID=1770053 RepID=A0A1H2PN34_9BURK|nr:ATP-binding protein [Chitinasiproducens palmae]SDV48072.1 Signal transduction histidine kinase [Chitinasiproducens palmae]
MKSLPILTSKLRKDLDVPLARQRARQIAAAFGLEALDQTRLATAVSEIARNAVAFAGEGRIEFAIRTDRDAPMLVVTVSDNGPGLPAAAVVRPGRGGRGDHDARGGLGIAGSRRLTDTFDIVSGGDGTTVELGMYVPALGQAALRERVASAAKDLTRTRDGDPLAELEQQNREILRTLDELRAHQLQLRQADQRKDEFLAMLAHELRNPLAAILNGIEFLRVQRSEDSAWGGIEEMMNRQARHLSRLVDDLLDVSRITQGTVQIRREPVEAATLIASATETCEALVGARSHRLTVELPDQPVWVDADVTRLTQVLGNLLNNAAKYTPSGGEIRLRLTREGSDAVFSVRDNGVGIDAAMLPKVFDLFARADSAINSSESGLGIGLTIVQRMAELHGGSVTVHSEGVGHGSEFLVRLPAVDAPAPASTLASADTEAAAPQGEILIVDDNVDSADSLALVLGLYDYRTRTAYGGLAALAAVEERMPRAVILDIGMPDLDGYEVARRLRARHGPEEMLLIGLSGYGDESVARRAAQSGFDHRLVKPVDMDALRKLLANLA